MYHPLIDVAYAQGSKDADAPARFVRIVIADEFPIFRDGLRRLLETEGRIQIVGDTDLDHMAATVRELRPDILLLGPPTSGKAWNDALALLRTASASVRTILMARSIDVPEVTAALRDGARGVVAKDSPADVLFRSIETVSAGALWIGTAPAGDDMAASVRRLGQERRRQQRFGLTRRELEIVRAIADGRTNREIAARLAISQNTVKRHLLHIFNKLGASSRIELALFAAHHQLLESV